MKHYIKNSKNIYMPGFFDTTLDICQLNKGIDDIILLKLIPHVVELLGKYAHPCPYVVSDFIIN
jgi:hypothetical protein